AARPHAVDDPARRRVEPFLPVAARVLLRLLGTEQLVVTGGSAAAVHGRQLRMRACRREPSERTTSISDLGPHGPLATNASWPRKDHTGESWAESECRSTSCVCR